VTVPRYVALLRAITHVPMHRFRLGLEELGFMEVESFGMSGNLLFSTSRSGRAALERVITDRLKARAFVRTRAEMHRIVEHDPFASAVLFLDAVPAARRQAFRRLEFEEPRPVLDGRTVYFVHPARARGSRMTFDFERFLGVAGTARSARVVQSVLRRMTDSE
jgi:uncharacterized protein (DUF1697 family)